MRNEKKDNLYSLIPLDDFKTLLGIDDREDKLCRFCLVTATLTIEQYCKRKLLRKKCFETIEFYGDLILPLKEFPVTKILAVFVENPHPCGFSTRSFCNAKTPAKAVKTAASRGEPSPHNGSVEDTMPHGDILEPEFYSLFPYSGTDEDIPYSLSLSPALKRYRGLKALKAVYWAGYQLGKVPADLASACMELAAWNMARYRGRKIGMTSNVRGKGRDGEHFEMVMPENVKALLEPHRRKTI